MANTSADASNPTDASGGAPAPCGASTSSQPNGAGQKQVEGSKGENTSSAAKLSLGQDSGNASEYWGNIEVLPFAAVVALALVMAALVTFHDRAVLAVLASLSASMLVIGGVFIAKQQPNFGANASEEVLVEFHRARFRALGLVLVLATLLGGIAIVGLYPGNPSPPAKQESPTQPASSPGFSCSQSVGGNATREIERPTPAASLERKTPDSPPNGSGKK